MLVSKSEIVPHHKSCTLCYDNLALLICKSACLLKIKIYFFLPVHCNVQKWVSPLLCFLICQNHRNLCVWETLHQCINVFTKSPVTYSSLVQSHIIECAALLNMVQRFYNRGLTGVIWGAMMCGADKRVTVSSVSVFFLSLTVSTPAAQNNLCLHTFIHMLHICQWAQRGTSLFLIRYSIWAWNKWIF